MAWTTDVVRVRVPATSANLGPGFDVFALALDSPRDIVRLRLDGGPAELIARMEPGSVVVDVAIDQGGCVETIRPTTLLEPVYTLHGVLHYGVTNMPALVPRTSTYALTNASAQYLAAVRTASADPSYLGFGLGSSLWTRDETEWVRRVVLPEAA